MHFFILSEETSHLDACFWKLGEEIKFCLLSRTKKWDVTWQSRSHNVVAWTSNGEIIWSLDLIQLRLIQLPLSYLTELHTCSPKRSLVQTLLLSLGDAI